VDFTMKVISQRLCAAVILSVLFLPNLPAQRHGDPPQQWHEKYAGTVARLDAMTVLPIMSWRTHEADIPHGEDPMLDDSEWKSETVPYSTGRDANVNSGPDRAWYRAKIEVPATLGGRDIRGARLRLAVRFSKDGRIFVNSGLVAQGDGRTLDPVLLTNKATAGQVFFIAIKVPFHEEQGRFLGARIIVDHPDQPDPGVLRTEIQTAEAGISGFPSSIEEHERQLDKAVQDIDFTALDRGDQAAFTHSMESATTDLQPIREWMKQFTVRLVGNAHIDMAWLWPWTETVEVVRDTFATALQLMNEYPEFSYTQSSVQDFEWMEQKYPAEFKEIQKRVKEGRWELVGGMWVEPDLNMPDGESLVRQILVGKRYFHSKFGVDVNIGWNPDSFGYSWQLPQIYKKSGFDSFVTQKISWNETTVFPHKLFWWQAPDGSRLLTYFPHTYNGTTEPVGLANDVAVYVPTTHFPEIMQLYGVGDHGGGPTREELDEAIRLEKPSSVFPKVEFSTARSFFDDVEESIKRNSLQLPVWDGELYLENHRGCYTTQSETKKQIRHNEEQLEDAEKFSALAFVTSKQPYSNTEFEGIWKKLLFDDFHDIMPGSGVSNTYLDASRNLNEASLASENLLDHSLNSLTTQIDTTGPGVPVVVFNPLSWQRSSPVTVEIHTPASGKRLQAIDATGTPLISQVLSSDRVTQQTKLQVLVKDVPSLGYSVIHIVPATDPEQTVSALKVSGTTIENQFLRVTVDAKTGCVTSLVDKVSNKETVAPGGCGNLLQTFVDLPPRQDAWEIKFDGKSWDLKDPEEVKIVESGPERVVLRIKNKFQDSDFIRDLIVNADAHRVDVDMKVNWHEQHILLKVGFPVNVESDKATFEIPYGSIERPTTRNTPAEAAQFEVPAERWGDISNESHGFSLLNASKYGYDAKANVIRLSLLRSPNTPAPDGSFADQGFHEFTYALYPHSGNWKTGDTMRQGYELNYPLIPIEVQPHAGSWPKTRSFATVEPANVIMTALKKAEDSNDLIFRFYEFQGKSTKVVLRLPEAAVSAAETNLLEKHEQAMKLQQDGHELIIPTEPYEIKTIGVSFPAAKD
jgi:alpha-mannosidase